MTQKQKSDESENGIQTLEEGDIYFFYRPRVEEESPESESDIQRLYMVLSPEEKKKYRLAIIGQKHLGDPEHQGERIWGFVEKVARTLASIKKELAEEKYDTKTRGERHVPAARAAGEGVYQILRHDDHTHLIYRLELPEQTGEVQEDLAIEPEASYIISVKNPEQGKSQNVGLPEAEQAHFPQRLMKVFQGRKFADVDPPDFLDHPGAEFLLILASADIQEELGIQLQIDRETQDSADLFKDLQIDKSRRQTKPLLEGKWA